jgi:hypothetical protein
MPNEQAKKSKLAYLELAAIDLTITAMERAGKKVGDVSTDDNPREQWAEAFGDAHHPFIELSERDREIVGKIRVLASQLSSHTSLQELLIARSKIVQGG